MCCHGAAPMYSTSLHLQHFGCHDQDEECVVTSGIQTHGQIYIGVVIIIVMIATYYNNLLSFSIWLVVCLPL